MAILGRPRARLIKMPHVIGRELGADPRQQAPAGVRSGEVQAEAVTQIGKGCFDHLA